MFHYDYAWDLYPNYLKLDDELDTDRLGWHEGDVFRFETYNGTRMLKKVDPIEKFARGYGNEK
jgi:hypothetical protein